MPLWHLRHINRLVKTPKLHMGDTGLANALLRLDAAALHANRALLGQLLETFVFQELRRQASAHSEAIVFYHFRNRDDHEVDIVLEQGSVLAGVEVKASGTVRAEDFRRACTRSCGEDAPAYSAHRVFEGGNQNPIKTFQNSEILVSHCYI